MKKNSIRVRILRQADGSHVFKTILIHPMEMGDRRHPKTREIIPADYIEEFQVSVDGLPIFEMVLGVNISKNPFLSFRIVHALIEGQQLTVSWIDNYGEQTVYDIPVDFSQGSTIRYSGEQKGAEELKFAPVKPAICKEKSYTAQ